MKQMMLNDVARGAILGQLREAVIVVNAVGEVVFVNEAAKALHGADALGGRPADYAAQYNLLGLDGSPFLPDDLPLTRAVRYGETIENFRWRIQHPDGRNIIAIGSAKPILDESGQTIGAVLTASDDTERHQLEDQLRTANDALESRVEQAIRETRAIEAELQQLQRLDAISRLTGGVAHEINNVLTVVMTCLEEVLALPGDASVSSAARDALVASDRGGRLTQQLLSFGRRQPLSPRTIDLEPVFEEVALMLAPLGRDDVRFCFPASPVIDRPFVDRARLVDALLNLALNALDAMPSGGRIDFAVETIAARAGEQAPGPHTHLAILVRDTGDGMDADTLARAVEPFFTTRGLANARGLGLSAVDGFARQSNGALSLCSQPGHGTTACLILPRGTPSRRVDTRTPILPLAKAEHVLLVEDDPQVLRSVAQRIERLGHRVTPTDNVADALACIDQNTDITLVLSDIMMHGRPEGIDFANTLRTRFPQMPIVLTSGHVEGVASAPLPAKVRFLPKPFRADDLARALSSSTQFARNYGEEL